MDKFQFFLKALQADTFKYKEWVISVFAVVGQATINHDYPYKVKVLVDGKKKYYAFVDPDTGMDVEITGTDTSKPILSFKDRIKLKVGDLPNVKAPVETNCGNVLFNAMVLCWPFGDKIDFLTGKVSGDKLDVRVASMLADAPPEGKARDPKKIYVDELLKYNEALSGLAGLTQLCTPAASPKSMTIDKAVLRRRDELLKEYGDRIRDPAILAKIEGELVAMDKASFEGDPAADFFAVSGKSFDVSRKRSYIMHGAEVGFGDESKGMTVITESLQEGWDPKNLPILADSLRAGSYNRGNQTALGGESVKYFYRIFQNTTVAEDDCGSIGGLYWDFDEDNYKQFVGLYAVQNGKAVLVTEELAKKAIGKKILIRSPMLCKTKAPSFCAKCVGDVLASTPTGLHVAASDVGSTFMNAFMKSMHGKALKTAKYDYRKSIN